MLSDDNNRFFNTKQPQSQKFKQAFKTPCDLKGHCIELKYYADGKVTRGNFDTSSFK